MFEELNHADQLSQMLVDMQEGNEESASGENESEQETGEDSEDESRGIDLMSSDNEDDEGVDIQQNYPRWCRVSVELGRGKSLICITVE